MKLATTLGLVLALALTGCGSDEPAETAATVEPTTEAPTATPEPTATETSAPAEPVDLTVIPDDPSEIDQAYVEALADATAQMYRTLAEETAPGGNVSEVGRAIISQEVSPGERSRIQTAFEEEWDGTLVRPPSAPVLADIRVQTAALNCISVLSAIEWSPLATELAEYDSRDHWIIWFADQGGDGSTAWNLAAIRLNAEGGVTEDPCLA